MNRRGFVALIGGALGAAGGQDSQGRQARRLFLAEIPDQPPPRLV